MGRESQRGAEAGIDRLRLDIVGHDDGHQSGHQHQRSEVFHGYSDVDLGRLQRICN